MYSPFDDTPIGIVNEPEDRIHFISSSRIPFSRHKRESLFEGESSLSQSVFRHKRRQIARFEIEEIRKHVQKATVEFKILYRSDVASLLLPQTSLLFVPSTHLFIDVTQFRSLDLNLLFGSLESSIEIGVSMENQILPRASFLSPPERRLRKDTCSPTLWSYVDGQSLSQLKISLYCRHLRFRTI
jgi:hypothetical protein